MSTMIKEKPDRLTYTVTEAAGLLGVCKNQLYYAIARGEFGDIVIRVGQRILISKAALERRLSGEYPKSLSNEKPRGR